MAIQVKSDSPKSAKQFNCRTVSAWRYCPAIKSDKEDEKENESWWDTQTHISLVCCTEYAHLMMQQTNWHYNQSQMSGLASANSGPLGIKPIMGKCRQMSRQARRQCTLDRAPVADNCHRTLSAVACHYL